MRRAFRSGIPNVEGLKKALVAVEFEARLRAFEGAVRSRGNLKNIKRRKDFCTHHAKDVEKIENFCSQYGRLVATSLQCFAAHPSHTPHP